MRYIIIYTYKKGRIAEEKNDFTAVNQDGRRRHIYFISSFYDGRFHSGRNVLFINRTRGS